ncbi:MAG: multimeric flavodoxin WrbA [Candidatus Aldehydirespiratoraceae bacterium]
MPRLLIIHHSPTPLLLGLHAAALAGASADGIEGVDVQSVGALDASFADVEAADGVLLGTPANLGYISGALKHFFDTTYAAALGTTRGLPFGAYVRGESDTTGAVAAIEKITTGLEWRRVQPVLAIEGARDDAADLVWELAASIAATIMSNA